MLSNIGYSRRMTLIYRRAKFMVLDQAPGLWVLEIVIGIRNPLIIKIVTKVIDFIGVLSLCLSQFHHLLTQRRRESNPELPDGKANDFSVQCETIATVFSSPIFISESLRKRKNGWRVARVSCSSKNSRSWRKNWTGESCPIWQKLSTIKKVTDTQSVPLQSWC